MKIISTIIIINFLFSQGNYQILNSPSNFKEIFKDNRFEYSDYSTFHTSFPAKIDFYSFDASLSKIISQSGYNTNNLKIIFNFQSLDYGRLYDNISNDSFSANEILIKIKINKKINQNINVSISGGFLESNIDKYNSSAFLANAMLSYKLSNDIININIKNLGKVIKKYTQSEVSLPTIFSLSYIKKINPLSFIVNYENNLNTNDDLYSISSQFRINNNFKLYFGIDENKKNLIYGDYIEELISGLRTGISFQYSEYIFYLAFQNMGAAGYSTSVSFQKINL